MGAANQGIVDVVADSISMTCLRAQQVGFSADYYDAHQELIVERSNDTASVTLDAQGIPQIGGLIGKKVCTVGGTTSITNILGLEKQGGFTTVTAENWSDCLVLLQQGEVQAVTTDNNLLGGFEAEDPYLKIVGQPMSDEQHGLAIPRSYPDLSSSERQFLSFINGVLTQLESSNSGWCPETRLPSDASCWAALYRVWIQPGLGGTVPSPPSLLGYTS
jgi:polar amino acid transport system substrate-binding protein